MIWAPPGFFAGSAMASVRKRLGGTLQNRNACDFESTTPSVYFCGSLLAENSRVFCAGASSPIFMPAACCGVPGWEAVVGKANVLHPDLLLLTGDMVDGSVAARWNRCARFPPAMEFLQFQAAMNTTADTRSGCGISPSWG